ncbi:hypothetical protein [Massilia sp. Root418]|jgi:hypothetical protein|uniref:hypothetical protein n=1 Tax=Massilia sp. Root418 TaxID=1736532 RepID=UPI000AB1428B|nr:hypothetical protein [Massilia sp. Root418]
MSNKNLANELGDKLKEALVKTGHTGPVQDLELTDSELDDVAGGGSCGAMCQSFSLA